ncbi:uncharacterized protein EI90DRAFT_3289094 [Cantharellus anzutake]|uniref:uncharacterized protein n=1 Tax=Cantharellus anzutake TaxID=1750568 RepID=UPI001908404D
MRKAASTCTISFKPLFVDEHGCPIKIFLSPRLSKKQTTKLGKRIKDHGGEVWPSLHGAAYAVLCTPITVLEQLHLEMYRKACPVTPEWIFDCAGHNELPLLDSRNYAPPLPLVRQPILPKLNPVIGDILKRIPPPPPKCPQPPSIDQQALQQPRQLPPRPQVQGPQNLYTYDVPNDMVHNYLTEEDAAMPRDRGSEEIGGSLPFLLSGPSTFDHGPQHFQDEEMEVLDTLGGNEIDFPDTSQPLASTSSSREVLDEPSPNKLRGIFQFLLVLVSMGPDATKQGLIQIKGFLENHPSGSPAVSLESLEALTEFLRAEGADPPVPKWIEFSETQGSMHPIYEWLQIFMSTGKYIIEIDQGATPGLRLDQLIHMSPELYL